MVTRNVRLRVVVRSIRSFISAPLRLYIFIFIYPVHLHMHNIHYSHYSNAHQLCESVRTNTNTHVWEQNLIRWLVNKTLCTYMKVFRCANKFLLTSCERRGNGVRRDEAIRHRICATASEINAHVCPKDFVCVFFPSYFLHLFFSGPRVVVFPSFACLSGFLH